MVFKKKHDPCEHLNLCSYKCFFLEKEDTLYLMIYLFDNIFLLESSLSGPSSHPKASIAIWMMWSVYRAPYVQHCPLYKLSFKLHQIFSCGLINVLNCNKLTFAWYCLRFDWLLSLSFNMLIPCLLKFF